MVVFVTCDVVAWVEVVGVGDSQCQSENAVGCDALDDGQVFGSLVLETGGDFNGVAHTAVRTAGNHERL
jgi:hypothetical protein